MADGIELNVFDRQRMLENLDGDEELFKTLCAQFLTTHTTMLDNVRSAVASKDAPSLAASAHKLKGSLANFFAERAREAALALEKFGKSATFDSVDEAFGALEAEVRSLIKLLESEINGVDSSTVTVTNPAEPATLPTKETTPVSIDAAMAPNEAAPGSNEIAVSEVGPELAVCNFEKLIKDIGSDHRLFREIGGAFLKTCPQQMAAIRTAATSKNGKALIDTANRFKGMVAAYYAKRVAVAAEALARRGAHDNFDGVTVDLENLEREVEVFCAELSNAISSTISCENTDTRDNLLKKKGDVLGLVEELRISVETTYTLKTAIQNRMNDLEARLSKKEKDFTKLQEDFELLRKAMQNPETSHAAPSSEMLEIVTEMNDKIFTIEKEFLGGKAGLDLTRKDMAGIVGMLKDFRKLFFTIFSRFGAHMAKFHPEKEVAPKSEKDWSAKKYNLTRIDQERK
jgi:HPt (histidine-containing phosphotransfer) domain-containing protein